MYTRSGTENIEGFGTAEVTVITPSGKQKIHLINAAYVPGFHTNLVCNRRLNKKGVFWHNEGNYLYRRGGEKFAYCGYHHGQVTLEYNELKPSMPEDASFAARPTEPLLNQKVDGRFSHSRLGHAGIDAVGRLPKEVTGAVVEGSTTVEYETCAVSKAHKTVLEGAPTDNETSFGGEFNDWIADQGITMDSMKRTPQEELDETTQEELNETSKEELDETSEDENETSEDEDKTQVDIGGSRQVDSGGNQDQATDREELDPQDDDAIGPRASKDDPPPGLPTLAQPPEPQSTASTNRESRFKYIPEKKARPRQEIRDNIGDNKIAEGRRKKQLMRHQAYLTNIDQQIHSNRFQSLPKNWKELLSHLYKISRI